MEKLSNPRVTIETIQKHNFSFQKRFGQNFLIDAHVLNRIVEAAAVTKEDCVVEIGPGIGTMTQYLAEAAREVIAVEIDDALIPILQETLAPYDNVTVIHGDILKTDLSAIAREKNEGRPLKIVANLPYYITTPIVMGIFESHVPVSSITVMVQKEVAERMQAGPGTKDYGALSLAVQFYANAHIAANVPPNCFMPRPNVGSAVIHLDLEGKEPTPVKNEKALFTLIRAAFGQRRKTLVNAVGNASDAPWTKEDVTKALESLGISEKIRGEALSLEQFALLCDALTTA